MNLELGHGSVLPSQEEEEAEAGEGERRIGRVLKRAEMAKVSNWLPTRRVTLLVTHYNHARECTDHSYDTRVDLTNVTSAIGAGDVQDSEGLGVNPIRRD